MKPDNPKVIVEETGKYGKGLRAIRNISKGEVITDWTGGKVHEAIKCTDLPKDVADHAIQFEEHKWIDTKGIGRYSNHSCNPNCGIRGKFRLVAMKNIKKGDWLTWDYEMTEDSDWRMNCQCGEKNCRKIIGAYKNMPKAIRKKYREYTSDWLTEKYRVK